ncbi:alginate lyase family protein [Pelomonas sp. SE-A7]|uniref:alginate lyase family protein n=1 Tax=Pelomonas sp. SE-A7 TaxID=3054953 RepID=UPI00259D2254|nr:alginate lyase family protein [Pelomonas sp. SE-A7]MDM4765917.1 alginate lyase family protein [Pelomonas sp. SE-A7]
MPKLTLAPMLACLLFAAPAQSAPCPAPPAALGDMQGNGYYTDKNYSIVDPVLKARNEAAAKPFTDFADQVSRRADLVLAGGPEAAAAGACALQWLQAWAEGRAMLGQIATSQAQYLRKWTLASLSLAYLKLRPQASEAQHNQIAAWLREVAKAALDHIGHSKAARNNHVYWVGLAVMATAEVSEDAALRDQARRLFEEALSDIRDDGSLPQEMARAGKALAYHNYALAPLVLIAELAARRGEDWYSLQGARLDRLVERTAAGIADPAWFVTQTGVSQELPRGGITGWALLYADRGEARRQRVAHLLVAGPLRNVTLGGELQLMRAQRLFATR